MRSRRRRRRGAVAVPLPPWCRRRAAAVPQPPPPQRPLRGRESSAGGLVRGMAGPAAEAASRIGQGRWGLVGWVDWAGQTGTQVMHPQLLAPALLGQLRG